MNHAYLLEHSYENEYGEDETKTIGIYSTEREAKEAIERLKKQPGFSDLPEHFIISKYELNKDHWSEGFSSEKYIRKFSVWCKDLNGGITVVSTGHTETEALREVRQFSKKKTKKCSHRRLTRRSRPWLRHWTSPIGACFALYAPPVAAL